MKDIKKIIKNFGFISKRKVAKEIAYIYFSHENTPCDPEQFKRDCEAQSALNYLCDRLGIKPMHLCELGGGTGELKQSDMEKIRRER